MQKFEHQLRTTIHTRSVEQIMTRSQAGFHQGREFKLSNPKIDNICTYLRKFEIDRQNLNLAKRIMQCQSEHSRDRYVRQWKKVKKFMRVRSNFKPQLSAEAPKIFKFQEIPGHGRLLIKIVFSSVSSHMKQLSSHCLYLMKFCIGGTQIIPNKNFMTLDTSQGYNCQFLAPLFLKNKGITVKLIKVIENSQFDAGKFLIQVAKDGQQQAQIWSKTGKMVGKVCFSLEKQTLERKEHNRENSDVLETKRCKEEKQDEKVEKRQLFNN